MYGHPSVMSHVPGHGQQAQAFGDQGLPGRQMHPNQMMSYPGMYDAAYNQIRAAQNVPRTTDGYQPGLPRLHPGIHPHSQNTNNSVGNDKHPNSEGPR